MPVFFIAGGEKMSSSEEKLYQLIEIREEIKKMRSLQEAKLNMYQTVKTHCDGNATVVASIPAFQTAFNDFKAKIAEIVAAAQQKSADLTGITADKNQRKQALCQQTAKIAGALYAFAATTSNNELKQQVNVSLSKLQKLSDNQLIARCQNIHDAGVANIDALGDYGIKPGLLSALQTAIDEYAAAAPKPRTARSQRKALTGSLSDLFKEADAILIDRMDSFINLIRETNPDFADIYENARQIVDPNTTTTQLKGVVTNKTDGTPIKGASVTIIEIPQTTTTDSAGEYSFKPIINGKYTMQVKAAGFQDFEDDEVEVKLGAVNHVDVELVSN
ncbi:MAG TPA: carboxypeptidase-like regulatory domain-containing protein [Pyrinomonadaceae bacterium]